MRVLAFFAFAVSELFPFGLPACADKALPEVKAPPDYLKWHVWYMKYQKGKTWAYVAGYSTTEGSLYYRWKGVSLRADQVPGIDRLTNRTPVYDLGKLTGLKQVEIDPPVRYWLLKSGSYAVGYFDPHEWKFFRWQGITLGGDQLLPDVPGHPKRIVPWPKKDLKGRPYTGDEENDHLVSIDPPAHLVQQPKAWKRQKGIPYDKQQPAIPAKTSLQADAKALVGAWSLDEKFEPQFTLVVNQGFLFLAVNRSLGADGGGIIEPSVLSKYKIIELDNKRYIELSDAKAAKAARMPVRIGYHLVGDRLELDFADGSLKGKRLLKRAS